MSIKDKAAKEEIVEKAKKALEIEDLKIQNNNENTKYIKKLFPSMPDSTVYKLFRKKYFELNGKKAEGSYQLKNGDNQKIYQYY